MESELDHVVIDTNYFFTDPEFRHAVWGDLLELQRLGQVKLYVPEVVILEQVRHVDDPSHSALNNSIQAVAKAKGVLAKNGIELPVDIADLRRQRDSLKAADSDYERRFRKHLDDGAVTVLPHPSIDMTDLIDAHLRGRKPFKENGDGLPDYVIWRSVVELVESLAGGERLIFISRNSKDFGPEGKLHPELAATVDASRVQIFAQPKSYVDTLSLQTLPSARFNPSPELVATESELDQAFDLAKSYVDNFLLYRDADIDGYQPPTIFESPTIGGVELDKAGAEWNPYDEMEDGTQLGRLDVPAAIQIDAFAYKADLAITDGVRVTFGDFNDHMSEVADEVEAVIEFHVRISDTHSEVLNIESIRAARARDYDHA